MSFSFQSGASGYGQANQNAQWNQPQGPQSPQQQQWNQYPQGQANQSFNQGAQQWNQPQGPQSPQQQQWNQYPQGQANQNGQWGQGTQQQWNAPQGGQQWNQQPQGQQWNQPQGYNQGPQFPVQQQQQWTQPQGPQSPQQQQWNQPQGPQSPQQQQWNQYPQGQANQSFNQGAPQNQPQAPFRFADIWKSKFLDVEYSGSSMDGSVGWNGDHPIRQMWGNDSPEGHQFITWGRKVSTFVFDSHFKGKIDIWNPGFLQTPAQTFQLANCGRNFNMLRDLDVDIANNRAVVAVGHHDDFKNYRIELLNLATGQFTEVYGDESAEPISAICYLKGESSPQVATATTQGQVGGGGRFTKLLKVHDLTTGRPVITEQLTQPCNALRVGQYPHLLHAGLIPFQELSTVDIVTFDVREKSFVPAQKFFGMAHGKLNSLEIPSNPGNLIVAAQKAGPKENGIFVWDNRKQAPLHTFPELSRDHYSYNGQRATLFSNLLACANPSDQHMKNRVQLFDISGGTTPSSPEVELTLPRHGGDATNEGPNLCLIPHSKTLVMSWERFIWKIDLAPGK